VSPTKIKQTLVKGKVIKKKLKKCASFNLEENPGHLVNKVKLKLISWKIIFFSMMSQIQLINTVITGFLVYSFNMYKWFVSILK